MVQHFVPLVTFSTHFVGMSTKSVLCDPFHKIFSNNSNFIPSISWIPCRSVWYLVPFCSHSISRNSMVQHLLPIATFGTYCDFKYLLRQFAHIEVKFPYLTILVHLVHFTTLRSLYVRITEFITFQFKFPQMHQKFHPLKFSDEICPVIHISGCLFLNTISQLLVSCSCCFSTF